MSSGKELRVWNLTPTSLGEALKFGEMLATSGLVPDIYINNPAGIVAACEMGSHLGFTAMQSLQSIAVINGMPALWGDALPALAMGHPKYEYLDESFDDSAMVATCKIKREGAPEQIRRFSWSDAERAGLTSKDTYKKYPKRMLQVRARAWAVRDVFPDALKGCGVVEEVRDIPTNAATDEDYRNVVAEGQATHVADEPEKPAHGMARLDEALDEAQPTDAEAPVVESDDMPTEAEIAMELELADWKAKMDEAIDEPDLERVGHELFDMADGTLKSMLKTYYKTRLKDLRLGVATTARLGGDSVGDGQQAGEAQDG